jgi:hypothetical protein
MAIDHNITPELLFLRRPIMAIKTTVDEVLHHIRVKLYPNYLPKGGKFIARTNNEASLDIEQVCAALKNRGGYDGNYDTLIEAVRKYYEEVAYQLCDGYAVNNGYYAIYPNIGGTFDSVKEVHDHNKHPIDFRFSIRTKLRNFIKNIAVEVEGMADTGGYIDTFIDNEGDYVNSLFLPGNMFAIHGNKIKLEGDDPACGVFFVPKDDPSKAVKVARIAENFPSRVTGIAPDTEHQFNRIEIRTQYSGVKDKCLKSPRTIASIFVIEAA